jgi:uncharacterized protein YecE (DUF72 family)
MQLLGEKLGVLLVQLPYFSKAAFSGGGEFLKRLEPFIKNLPPGVRFALEVRNKSWLTPTFLDLLRSRGVALALIDHPWMPRPLELAERINVITADFCYVRFLGDRKAIEQRTKVWDHTIIDRRAELSEWAKVCYQVKSRGATIFAYANNHYAGHGPATIRLFQDLFQDLFKDPFQYPFQDLVKE